jgi:hypothetical protein
MQRMRIIWQLITAKGWVTPSRRCKRRHMHRQDSYIAHVIFSIAIFPPIQEKTRKEKRTKHETQSEEKAMNI